MNVARKSLKLMSRREKQTGILLLGLTVLKGVAETVGVASILPFLSILGQPELVESNKYASKIYQAFSFTSVNQFLFALGIVVIFVLVTSSLLKVTTVYATNRWVQMRGFSLARRIMESYLRQSYSYFLTRNTSRMANLILTEAHTIATGIYRPILELFNSAITFILIASLLLWANPLITITSVLAIGASYFILYVSLRGFIKHKGETILAANQNRYRRVNETFTGIKQVKLSSLENFSLALFSKSAKDLAQARAISNTLSQVPKFGLEVIAFGGIVVLTLVLFRQSDGSIEESLPLLVLYALAGYRLLPIFQTTYRSVLTLRVSIPSIDRVIEDLNDTVGLANLPRTKIEPIPLENSIMLDSVCYAYPETAATGLQKIDLEIRKGESLGVAGTTGAGKTTLVDVLLGLLEVKNGSIFIDEIRLDASNVRNWQASIGYVPQDIFLSDASVAENIAMGVQKTQISPEKLERAARAARLYDFVTNELPDGFQTNIGERGVRLSGGQRQRLGIARALYNDPQVIVFDEATSALDNTTERELISEISQMSRERTIIMIAHRLSTIKNCDHIIILDNGTIIGKGTYEELVESNSKFREMVSHQN
ncbi:ABC transporter ATP-binding protein [Ruegeria arenilitoris]|uniref:ABC transporter ATP-binding protein n=1 Tax=Ruegeria arenilitoris TaxID=1173585 RepID=UPI00147D03DA|nr:ABC transporter ATP-binding protein [Ruegeria arenilitoris]